MLNPWDDKYPLVCDWACHIARGSSGGDDYAMPVGTPILASFDGNLTNRPPLQYPASGNVAILTRPDGVAFYHLHLSQFVAPGPYREGNIIGYSGGALGAPGSGQSTGPHLHVNAFNATGQIHDIHDYYGADTASSGTPTPITPTPTPTPPPTHEGNMYLIRSTSYGIDIIIRNDGYMMVSTAPDLTNQTAALLGIPIHTNDEYLNSTLTLNGAPDLGTMKANPGKWYAPIGR